jgi:hypothetical protein
MSINKLHVPYMAQRIIVDSLVFEFIKASRSSSFSD